MNISNLPVHDDLMCSKSFRQLVLTHRDIRAKFELSILVIGAVSNILNIIVLTRRNMKTSTNYLLTALATADLLLLVNEIPLYSYFVYDQDSVSYPYGWAAYLAFETVSKFIFNTISTWMTVLIGIWRNLVVYSPIQNRGLYTRKRTLLSIGIVYVVCLIMNIPVMLITCVNGIVTEDGDFTGEYFVNFYGCKTILTFQVIIVFNRTVPVIAITILCVFLITAIRRARLRRSTLTHRPSNASKNDEKSNKVTVTLLSVIVVFFITHIVIAIIFVTDFFYPLAQFIPVTNLFMFINSSVNIILYSLTSEEYRRTFINTFGLEKATHFANHVYHRCLDSFGSTLTDETIT